MELLKLLEADLTQALKAQDKEVLGVLRLLMASLKNREIELRSEKRGLNDEDVSVIIRREAKKRREAIEMFIKGGRQDLADKDMAEVKILEKYLPANLTEEGVRELAVKVKNELNATGTGDFGRVMKEVISRVEGRIDGGIASRLVKEILN